jgi:protein gp37
VGDRSKIEWTDATWSPIVGCKAVSPGCDHCYAARLVSGRLKHLPAYAGLAEGGVFNGEVRCLPERLLDPITWRKPRRIFVNSMSDLFHPAIERQFQAAVFAVMAATPRHTYQILTKRPQPAKHILRDDWSDFSSSFQTEIDEEGFKLGLGELETGWRWPLPNVWLGTSIESDAYAFRADHLRETPAAVRFLSLEPLLGPLPSLDLTGIDWVIAGGESGPGARPMHSAWVRDIRDRCVVASVPFLFKQWGEWAPDGALMKNGTWEDADESMTRVGKKAAGRELDGKVWDEYPG